MKKFNYLFLLTSFLTVALVLNFFGFKSKAETTTSSSTRTIILKDSDGDGILDAEDPHPEVAEIYIVKDENSNGIVDQFEQ